MKQLVKAPYQFVGNRNNKEGKKNPPKKFLNLNFLMWISKTKSMQLFCKTQWSCCLPMFTGKWAPCQSVNEDLKSLLNIQDVFCFFIGLSLYFPSLMLQRVWQQDCMCECLSLALCHPPHCDLLLAASFIFHLYAWYLTTAVSFIGVSKNQTSRTGSYIMITTT